MSRSSPTWFACVLRGSYLTSTVQSAHGLHQRVLCPGPLLAHRVHCVPGPSARRLPCVGSYPHPLTSPPHAHRFWQMVWEQSIDVIAMVTNEVCRCVMWPRSSWCVRQIEGGKLKAHRYWPSSFNQYVRLTLLCAHCSPTAPKEQHGALHVTLTSERAHLAYIKRTFQLKEVQTGLVCASPCAPLPSHLTHPTPRPAILCTTATPPGPTTACPRRQRRSYCSGCVAFAWSVSVC